MNVSEKLKLRLSPWRIIAMGFAGVILVGSVLLMLPISLKDGISMRYIDALYTATSAVCVTGLVVVDTADTFSGFGQAVIAVLIQIGGLGVASIGAGVILAMGKKMGLRGRAIIKEAMNTGTGKGVVRLVRAIFITTLCFEGIGAILSFFTFVRTMPVGRALWTSVFHSIASFNNAGFDVLGGFKNLADYKSDVYLNIVTSLLVIFGGMGFLLMGEVMTKRFKWKRFSLHTKVVLSVTATLLIAGTILLKLTENISWLGAFFASMSARTAGFSTYSLGEFSIPGLITMCVLMFIGASPGSTGGGVKTTTIFVMLHGMKAAATNRPETAFKYTIPKDAFRKAATVVLMGVMLIIFGTYMMSVFEPQLELHDVLFEIVSAFGTVGLSTGITPTLSIGSKILSICIMYIGRLGPLTVAALWYAVREPRIGYAEGSIGIG